MVITTNAGPVITFGITTTSSGGVQQYNEDRAPSMNDLGSGMMDPRSFYAYKPGMAPQYPPATLTGFGGFQTMGFLNNTAVVDFVPTALSTNGIVSNTAPVAGTAITITGSGAGIIKTTIIAPETGNSVSVYAIDSTAAYVNFGQSNAVAFWNPAAGSGRVITVNLSSNTDGGSFSVAGRDMYGFKITDSVAITSAANKGTKAFKYVSAITASTTINSTGVIIGYNDTYGFPFAANYVGQNCTISISSNAYTWSATSVVLSSGTVSLASTAATATSTTGDARGTFASSFAATGTSRLQITQQVNPTILAAVSPATSSAIFGQLFSSV